VAPSDGTLTAALETALVRELLATWKTLNQAYFRGQLVAPQIALVTGRHRLGAWRVDVRAIEISRPLVLEQPWGVVVEVLKHEMAHQYVHEVLGRNDEGPHGPAFQEACRRLGIDGAATGMPTAAPDAEEERIVARIAKLLALAESPNQHEAEAAMAAAQKLMLRYNIEGNVAAKQRPYGFRHLGKPSGRVREWERVLAMILGRHFFVEVIWVPVYRPMEGKRGSVLEICGTETNLALADYAHGFLTHTAAALWAAHKRELAVASDRDRLTYLAGVMAGFSEKLAREARRHTAEGLVWVKDADLASFYRKRHPYVRLVRHAGQRRNDAFAKGKEAGRRIVLRKGVEAAASSRGRLLPPASS
jgi:hypothetical protein